MMLCYSKQSLVRMTTKIPPSLTWHIYQIVINCLSLVVTTCVLNQSRGHWLLNDALHFTISMSLKLKEEPKNAPSFQTLMEKDIHVGT
jgi:hypothetical protein